MRGITLVDLWGLNNGEYLITPVKANELVDIDCLEIKSVIEIPAFSIVEILKDQIDDNFEVGLVKFGDIDYEYTTDEYIIPYPEELELPIEILRTKQAEIGKLTNEMKETIEKLNDAQKWKNRK